MIASFWVYIWGYQLDVRFGSLLGCLQIIFLQTHLAFPSKVTWMCSKVNWILWNTSLLFHLHYKFINGNYCFLRICFPGCAANHPKALLANIKITAFSPYHFTVKLLIIGKIQLVVYYQCFVLIGWATTRLCYSPLVAKSAGFLVAKKGLKSSLN